MSKQSVKTLKINPHYKIDESGNVYNRLNKLIKPWKSRSRKGLYLRVSLYSNGIRKNFRVHRLVAMQYIEPIKYKTEVDHIDGNTLNNNLSNLRWVSRKENEYFKKSTKVLKPDADK